MMLETSKLQLPLSGKSNLSVQVGVAHHLEAWTNNTKSAEFKQFLNGYALFIARILGLTKINLIFCKSGGEANQMAIDSSFKKRKNKKAKKVLAFSHTFTQSDYPIIRSSPLSAKACSDEIFAVIVDPALAINPNFFKAFSKLKIPIILDQTENGYSENYGDIITLAPIQSLGIVATKAKTKPTYKLANKVSAIAILSGYYQSLASEQGVPNRSSESLLSSTELLLEVKGSKIKNSEKLEAKYLTKLQKVFLDDEIGDFELQALDAANFETYRKAITHLEIISYEKARQTPISEFELTVNAKSSISFLLFYKKELVGMIFASAMKNYPFEKGLKADPYFKDLKTLYVVDCTIDAKLKGKNLGKFLKYAVTLIAQLRGFKRIEGRIRDRLAKNMLAINLSLGSYCYYYYKNFYLDKELYRDVLFYTTLIQWKSKPKMTKAKLLKLINFH